MIISHWAPWFTQLYGSKLPTSYLSFDLETSGWSRDRDVVVEWGHCLVRDCKPVNRISVLINWFATPEMIPGDYLEDRLLQVARQMALDGRPWSITPERLKNEGVHPETALNWIYDLLLEVQEQKLMFVSHNGWNFDYQMLVRAIRDIGQEFILGPNQMFDTGAIEKATQLVNDNDRALPRPGETMMGYFKRIQAWRASGIYWNLDTHCVKKYGLDIKYGIDAKQLHAAGEDAYVLHLLMEEFRSLITTPAVPPSPAVKALRPLPQGHVVRSKTAPAAPKAAVLVAAANVPVYRSQRNR